MIWREVERFLIIVIFVKVSKGQKQDTWVYTYEAPMRLQSRRTGVQRGVRQVTLLPAHRCRIAFFFFFLFLICADSCRPRPRCESGQFMPIRAKSGHIIQNYRNRPIQSVPAPIRPIQTETHRFKPSFKQKTLNSLPFCFSIYALLSLLALCSPLSQNHT